MEKRKHDMLFDASNYRIMLIGIALMIVGFLLMMGGNMEDGSIYSFQRITLAPALILLGFVVNGYAIMKKPASAEVTDKDL